MTDFTLAAQISSLATPGEHWLKMSETSQAVPAVLASALLITAEAEEGLLRKPLTCGLASIDDLVLDGGFRYGEIISIAGATSMGKTLVCSLLFDVRSKVERAALEGNYRVFFQKALGLYQIYSSVRLTVALLTSFPFMRSQVI